MLLFQFEGVAEQWLAADDWARLRTWAGHPDAAGVAAELAATGALTPGLNWYRANVPPAAFLHPPAELPPVRATTMGIWSSGDVALTEQQMVDSAERVTGPWRYERLEGVGHWLQLEAPEWVIARLLEFLPAGA
jgi:pimeloyl-ACP methyl ester carboxylesterase